MENFEQILSGVLKAFESNSGGNVDEILTKVARDYSLSDSAVDSLKETFSIFERYSQKSAELSAAKRDGQSRETWLKAEIESVVGKAGVQGEAAADEVVSCIIKSMEEER